MGSIYKTHGTMRKQLFYLAVLLLIISCRKDYTGQTIIEDNFVPTQTYERNGHGFVTDENDFALKEVILSVGGIEIETDENGYFSFEKIIIPSNGAYIKASKEGFFPGGHLIKLESKKQDYIKISLAKKSQQKIIPASSGGTVNFENGIQLTIPEEAFVSGGNNYNGLVYAQSILVSKNEERFGKLFPSSLLSYKDDEGDLFLQQTEILLSIIMQDEFNNELILKPGKEIMVLINSINDAQSNLIDNSSFLETTQGFWKEAFNNIDPSNELTFSNLGWWVLGSKNDKEKLCLNVKGQNDAPAAFSYVVLKDLNNNIIWEDYSDREGTICDFVPKNEILRLRVYDHCKINYEESLIDPINEEQSLDVTFASLSNKIDIQGTVFDCQEQTLNQGYIIFTQNEIPTYIPISNGSYTYTHYCLEQGLIQAKVVDSESGFYRNFDIAILPLNVVPVDFSLCDSDAEFMLYNIENSTTQGFSDCKVLQNPEETLLVAKSSGEEYFIISVPEFTSGTFPAIVFSSEGIAKDGEVSMTIDNYPEVNELMFGSIEGSLEGKNISGRFASKRIK